MIAIYLSCIFQGTSLLSTFALFLSFLMNAKNTHLISASSWRSNNTRNNHNWAEWLATWVRKVVNSHATYRTYVIHQHFYSWEQRWPPSMTSVIVRSWGHPVISFEGLADQSYCQNNEGIMLIINLFIIYNHRRLLQTYLNWNELQGRNDWPGRWVALGEGVASLSEGGVEGGDRALPQGFWDLSRQERGLQGCWECSLGAWGKRRSRQYLSQGDQHWREKPTGLQKLRLGLNLSEWIWGSGWGLSQDYRDSPQVDSGHPWSGVRPRENWGFWWCNRELPQGHWVKIQLLLHTRIQWFGSSSFSYWGLGGS